MRCTRGTLARTPGSLLCPRLLAAARGFAAGFGAVGAKACIRHLAFVRLVHQVYINWGFENRIRQIHRADFLSLHIQDINFHFYIAPVVGFIGRTRLLLARLADQHETATRTRHGADNAD